MKYIKPTRLAYGLAITLTTLGFAGLALLLSGYLIAGTILYLISLLMGLTASLILVKLAIAAQDPIAYIQKAVGEIDMNEVMAAANQLFGMKESR